MKQKLAISSLIDSKPKSFIAFALYFCLVLIAEIVFLSALCLHAGNGWSLKRLAVVVVASILALLLFVLLAKKYKHNYPNLFLLIAFPIAVGFWLFLIPTNTPDEPAHIVRVFDNRSASPLYIPEAMSFIDIHWVSSYPQLLEAITTNFDYSNWVITAKSNAAPYTTLNYLFPSLIVQAGITLNINGWVLVYAAQFTNMCLYLAACYWMLRKLPTGQLFMLLFFLNPILLQQETSCSADALCNIASLCFIVQLISMKVDQRPYLPIKEWIILFVFAIAMSLCKYVYLVLMLGCFILLPKIKRKYIRIGLPIVAIAGVLGVVLMLLSTRYNPAGLFSWLASPTVLIGAIDTTIARELSVLLWQFAGGNLGWPSLNGEPGQIEVPYMWMIFIGLLVASFAHYAKKGLSTSPEKKGWKFWLLATALICSFATFITLASSADPASGIQDISWLQGRYFIPMIFMAMLAFMHYRENAMPKNENSELPSGQTNETLVQAQDIVKHSAVYFALIVLINLVSVYYIIAFFYR